MNKLNNIVIYVAGPLTTGCFPKTGFDLYVWEKNIRRAEKVWFDLQFHGFAAICVHTMARYAFGRVSEAHGIAADLLILERCNVVCLAPGWQESKGTLGEIKHARSLHMPVFETVEECVEWRATRVTQVIDPSGGVT
jgi:uncharacterized protein DUF4406